MKDSKLLVKLKTIGTQMSLLQSFAVHEEGDIVIRGHLTVNQSEMYIVKEDDDAPIASFAVLKLTSRYIDAKDGEIRGFFNDPHEIRTLAHQMLECADQLELLLAERANNE